MSVIRYLPRRWPLWLLVALTLLLTWPLTLRIASHVPDRQDPLLNAWIMAWEARQLLMAPGALFDANIFYPQSNTLAFSETLFSTTALVLPVQYLFDNALLTHNVALLLAFFTTALGGYLLAYQLTGHRGPAIVAAVALAWAPYRIGQISQVQLLAFGWLPLALLYLDRLLRPPLEPGRGGLKDGLLFTLFLLLQALASFYAALFSAAALVLYVAGSWLWRRQLPTRTLVAVVGAGVVALVLIAVARPYFEVQRTLGAGWDMALNEQFSASLQSYAYAPALTQLWGPITEPLYYTHGACCPPSSLFPGMTLLVLSGLAVVGTPSGRRWPWVLFGASGFLLSLGPTFTITANEPTTLALPYRFLLEAVPGFDAIRAPVRWVVLLALALAMLSALGLARLNRPWWNFLAFALVLLEFSPAPLRLVPAPGPFPALEWLDEQPPTVILEFPLVAERPIPPAARPREAWEQSRLLEAQFFSTRHWHTTPDGYSGYVPSRHGDFAREMRAFPSARAATLLRGLGVRYVVIHEAELSEAQRASLAAPLPEGVQEVARFGSDLVLALDPLVTTRPRESLPLTSLPADQEVTVPLVLVPSQRYVPVPRGPLEVEATWEQPGEGEPLTAQQVRVALPVIVQEVGVLSLPLRSPPPGIWHLRVRGTLPPNDPFEVVQQVEAVPDAPAPPTLLPVTLSDATWLDGETVMLRWRSDAPLSRYYSLVVERLGPNGELLSAQNGPPGGRAGTLLWQPGQPYATRWHLPVPDGIDPADTTLRLRWYDPETDDEIWLWEGDAFMPVLTR